MKYQQLTEGLRYQIALLCEDKVSQAEIARRLGISSGSGRNDTVRFRFSVPIEPIQFYRV